MYQRVPAPAVFADLEIPRGLFFLAPPFGRVEPALIGGFERFVVARPIAAGAHFGVAHKLRHF